MKRVSEIVFFIIMFLLNLMVSFDFFSFAAIFMFASIIVSSFAFSQLNELGESNFWDLFLIQGIFLMFATLIFSPFIIFIYFFFCIFASIANIPNKASKGVTTTMTNYIPNPNQQPSPYSPQPVVNVQLYCKACGAEMKVSDSECSYCHTPFSGDNVEVKPSTNVSVNSNVSNNYLTPANFDPIFRFNENYIVNEYIKKEMAKAGLDVNAKLIPSSELGRKKILNSIFALLTFIYISIIFFHFPIMTYIVGLIILLVFFFCTRSYSVTKYIAKQLKARPNEKISNIVMNTRTSLVMDNSRPLLAVTLLVAIILPLVIFNKPRIIYEEEDGGYAVRYYIYGLTNFTRVTIPEEHNGKPVVTLRGNAFSNMPLLKEANLPDSIKSVRGQAFKNDYSLKKVKLPSKLEYLGGGAFYNCTSLEEIEIPDTVTKMGGETFYGCSSLKKVKLSSNITEIRGNSFEECDSLEVIDIPDKVTRIGGHAFYGCDNLKTVNISENSELKEIGSSAFRMCGSLYDIVLPSGTSVNTRAFKESPTVIRRYGEIEEEITNY